MNLCDSNGIHLLSGLSYLAPAKLVYIQFTRRGCLSSIQPITQYDERRLNQGREKSTSVHAYYLELNADLIPQAFMGE